MDSKFVIRNEHFHTSDHNRFVIVGWFEGEDPGPKDFEVRLDQQSLPLQVQCISDDSVRQKYAKNDKQVTKEYVIQIKLPDTFKDHRNFILYVGGTKVYECSVRQMGIMQKQLNYRITNIQMTGADCMLTGWVASERPFKLTVYDKNSEPVQAQIVRFPLSDIAREYREAKQLVESGFTVTIPVTGSKQKLVLQITDGEYTVRYPFKAQEKGRLVHRLRKAFYYFRRNGFKKTFKRAVNEIYDLIGDTGNYKRWRKKNTPSERELERQRNKQPQTEICIYGLLPFVSSPYVSEFMTSLQAQTFQNWKLLIAVTPEEQEQIQTHLLNFIDSRFVYVPVKNKDKQKRIDALIQYKMKHAATKQSWSVLLDVNDTLESYAFYHCVETLLQHPDWDMLYTDEDLLTKDGKEYIQPVFKTDYNPDLLRATNYLGNMVLLRGDLQQKLGKWDYTYQQAAEYDYYLRATEQATGIGHLTQAVYHRRSRAEEHDTKQEIRAIQSHYDRVKLPAAVEASETEGIYHTLYHWERQPLVSINIPNKDHIDDLDTCVRSVLEHCTYSNYEIVIIENNSTEERTFEYYETIQKEDSRVRVIRWEDSFNYSKITNYGVEHSNGEYILLLNNDTEVINPHFMEEMLGYCMREDVGICGARLYYFDDTIQHAGVIVGLGGICGEGFQGFAKENGGYQNRIFCPQNYSAVTAACLMTKKSVFEAVGGMDEELQVAYNDIDYCLKVRELGKLIVYNPFATLHHYEYKSRGTENTAAKLARYQREVDIFTTRWADLISKGDPYYSPNLTKRYQDFSLRRIELL